MLSLNLATAQAKPKELIDVVYKTTPQGDLHLDLYYPDGKFEEALPVVIYTHGGGWTTGNKNSARNASMGRVVKGMTEQGFAVASVQYRLWKKGGDTCMRDCVIDAKDAIRFLSKYSNKYGVDPERVYAFGDSAGGQICQILLLSPAKTLLGDSGLRNYSYTTVAGVSWYGPCDFEKTSLFNHNDREGFRDPLGPRILPKDYNPADKLALYREMSPINYLTKNSPPLLMIQGDGDTTIPVKHAYYMEAKAKELGAPVQTLIVKHAGHNWRKADGKTPIEPTRAQIIQSSIDFLVNKSL